MLFDFKSCIAAFRDNAMNASPTAARNRAEALESVEHLHIGARLKSLRKARAFSLGDLAGLTDMSEATLSRIENGQTLVSAHHLYILSRVLGVDITAFFETGSQPMRSGVRSISRGGDGAMVDTARFRAQVLCADLANKSMHPFINEISAPSLNEAGGLVAHAGEEYLHVLEGVLVLHSEHYAPLRLVAGDSLYFDGTMAHAYVNGGEDPARILVVTTADMPDPETGL